MTRAVVVPERGGTPLRQIFWSRNGAPVNVVGHRRNANTVAFRQANQIDCLLLYCLTALCANKRLKRIYTTLFSQHWLDYSCAEHWSGLFCRSAFPFLWSSLTAPLCAPLCCARFFRLPLTALDLLTYIFGPLRSGSLRSLIQTHSITAKVSIISLLLYRAVERLILLIALIARLIILIAR